MKAVEEASVTYSIERIEVRLVSGGSETVDATRIGPLAVHETFPAMLSWTVTHLVSGQAFFKKVPSQADAISRAEYLVMTWPDDLEAMKASDDGGWDIKPANYDAMKAYIKPLRQADEEAAQS